MTYQRHPGKFESSGALGELFHAIMLEGFTDDSVSGGDGEGADRFDGPFEVEKLRETWPAEVGQLSADERRQLAQAVGAVTVNDSQGFVDVGLFTDKEHFEDAWEQQQKHYSSYDDDDDGVDDFANNADHSTYRAAQAADEAWSNELHRLFGKKAGDVRYTSRGAGAPGSELRRLHDAKLAADQKLHREQGHSPNARTARQQLEALVWKHTHRDYRGVTNGVKYVLVNASSGPFAGSGSGGGTQSWPLSKLTDEQLCYQLPDSVREEHPELCGGGMQSNARCGSSSDKMLKAAIIWQHLHGLGAFKGERAPTPFELTKAHGISLATAHRIESIDASASGPGGQGQYWFQTEVAKLLRGGMQSNAGPPQQYAALHQRVWNEARRQGYEPVETEWIVPLSNQTYSVAVLDPLNLKTGMRVVQIRVSGVGRAGPFRANARRGGPADEQAATELEQYIDNDSRFSMDAPGTSLATGGGQGRSILLNQLRKFKKGQYDPAQAPKAWGYVVEAAAKEYAKEFDRPGNWMNLFTPATRDLVSQSLAESFLTRAQAGEFDHVDTRIGH